jgi:hypothetical protein
MVFPLPHRLAPESVGYTSILQLISYTYRFPIPIFRGFAAVFAEDVADVPKKVVPPGMLSSPSVRLFTETYIV